MVALAQAPLVIGWTELGVFLLANVIIFAICGGKLWADIKRWRKLD